MVCELTDTEKAIAGLMDEWTKEYMANPGNLREINLKYAKKLRKLGVY